MALDMNTHGKEIRKAVDSVASDSANDWCIIGYEGKTHTLYVHAEGDGGLEEMVDEFHGSKIMYGYVRVKEPNTGLPKFVFINWQGEGAPERMKFNCSSHSVDVQRLCRPVHVTVNARDESDIEPSEIVGKVVKAAGSQFSVLKSAPNSAPEARPVIAQKPKGSVYQKPNATAEILNRERDAYWQKLEREEAQQRQEEARRKKEERAKEERERKAREEREAREREQRTAERSRQIAAQRSQEQRAVAATKAPADQGTVDDVEADERERRSRSESIKNERQAELQSLLAARNAAGLQPSQKVSSSYKKVDPRAELANLQRDQYWNKLEEEEKTRKNQESKRSSEEASLREQQRVVREQADAKRREEAERERAQAISRQRAAEKQQAAEADKKKMEAVARAQHREATADEEERSSRSERLRKERQEEAARLIGQRGAASALRARFQDGGAAEPPSQPQPPVPAPAPVQPPAPVQQRYEPPPQQYEPPPQQYEPPPQQYEPPPQQYEPPPQQYEPPPQQYEPPAANPASRPLPTLPPEEQTNGAPNSAGWTAAQEAAYEPADDGYGDASYQAKPLVEDSQPEASPEEEPQGLHEEVAAQPEYQEEVPQPEYQDETPQPEYQDETPQPEEYQDEAPQQEDYAQGYDQGTCAEAIYDYTAAEEDEVSFNPGDIIIQIEQIDEGWWSGVTSDGHRGLFPSNYVRLI